MDIWSLIHSQAVTSQIVANYIGVGNGTADLWGWYAAAEERRAAQAVALQERVEALPGLSDSQMGSLEQRVRALQQKAGYTADYDTWIASQTPPDLE